MKFYPFRKPRKFALAWPLSTSAGILAMNIGGDISWDACESLALTALMSDRDEEPRLPNGYIGTVTEVEI